MESFERVTGIAAPLMWANVDTDQITPGRELVRGRKTGFGPSLFAGLRYLREREPNPEFLLNQPPYDRAVILLADRNFGCGSSRETAPMALRAFGFRSVIAPSFGGIFFNNCFRNGVLPVELPIEQVARIADQVRAARGDAAVTVDLQAQEVTAPDGARHPFVTPPTLRAMLLAGEDEISLTLARAAKIDAFRAADRQRRPWAY